VKVNKKKFVQIIKEETINVLKEGGGVITPGNPKDLDKRYIIAAAAFFAQRHVKGKEQEQVPVTIMSNTTIQEGDHFLKGGKSSKPAKIKRGKGNSVTFRKVRVGAKWDYDNWRTIKSLIKSPENEMNKKIDAVRGCLMYGKGDAGLMDSKNPFVVQIVKLARALSKAVKGQYPLKKWLNLGLATDVAGDSHIESNFLSRDHVETNKKTVDGKVTKNDKFGGSKVEDFMLCTTVEYLTGPLATKQPGQYAGIEAKMNKAHEKYVSAFGSKSLLGGLRKAMAPSELGGSGIGDESVGEFQRKLDKAMAGSDKPEPVARGMGIRDKDKERA
jgi:hypothetical protein